MTNNNPAFAREPLAVKAFMTPLRKINDGFGYLSAIPGYKGIVAPSLALYSLAIGVETAYKIMPDTSWSQPREERAFIPKMGVEDGAEFGRVVPFKNMLSAGAVWIAPDILDPVIPKPSNGTIWFDPTLWFSVVLVSAIQFYESKLFARKSYSEVKAEAQRANAQNKMEVSPRALTAARAKVARHNAYGMGQETMSGLTIIVLYGLEITGFLMGFKGATSALASWAYGFFTVFGFEVFHEREESSSEGSRKSTGASGKKRSRPPVPPVSAMPPVQGPAGMPPGFPRN